MDCEFDKVWDFLKMKGELSLQTEIEGKPFIAKATLAKGANIQVSEL